MKITTATQLLKHMRARLPTAGGPKRSGRVTPAGRNEMKIGQILKNHIGEGK